MFTFAWHVNCLAVALCVGEQSLAQQWLTDAQGRIEQYRKADLTVEVVDSLGQSVSGADVHAEMKRHTFGFGTAVPASWILNGSSNGQTFREKLLENFNQVVFENDLKYPPWIGLWGAGFNWPQTEQALDWLDANDLPTRGHYLSWATWSGNDAWGTSENINTLPGRIRDHISDKLPTVGTRVFEWDVINHPVGWLNDTYENRLENAGLYTEGLDFYAEIINHAREIITRPIEEEGLGGADMPLWINEDDVIAGNSRAFHFERIIDYLIDQGASPDGIGFQAHFIEQWGRVSNSTPEQVYERIDRFADKGLPLRATEFDIDVGTNEAWQAQLMHDYLTVMFSHPDMEAITMWGFWQGSHWMPNAALYRNDWSEKPSLTAYQDLVFSDWWTDEVGTADGGGQYDLRAFKGEYEVTVTYDGQEYVVPLILAEDMTLTVPLPVVLGLPGDFNGDGVVDAADYSRWRDHLGDGDESALNGNGDGLNGVDADDYALWVDNFGMTLEGGAGAGGSAIAAVPEPASWLLVGIAALGVLARRGPRGVTTYG